MSASEKLKALHARAEDAALIALREGWEGGQCCVRAGDIIQALEDFPFLQIVAVVEAAERVATTTRTEYGPDVPTWAMQFGGVEAALATLDDVLAREKNG